MKPDDTESPVPGPVPPPPPLPAALEDRIVVSLRERGLLAARGSRRVSWRRAAMGTLAAAMLLTIGFILGSRTTAPGGGEGDRFLLLLYGDAAASPAPGARDSVVAEYRRWAEELRSAEMLVLGEELAAAAAIVPDGAAEPRGPKLGGFFVVRARDLAHAIELARSTPHARGGGSVVVRPIART